MVIKKKYQRIRAVECNTPVDNESFKYAIIFK